LACNLVYTHLLDRLTHAEECDPQRGCAGGCQVDEFHFTLTQPLLGFEIAAEERVQRHLAALMRGEINVA
jgi:hypothetical protein